MQSVNTFDCACGNTLYFENSKCLACGKETGWCPACRTITALVAEGNLYRCANQACGARLAKCSNYSNENVCNRCVVATDPPPAQAPLCDCCIHNDTIPDLSVAGNREKWGRLEAAKRRLFYNLDLLGLPHGTAAEGFDPPLAFDFKADVIPANEFWRTMGAGERVYTGHSNGKITINIREADPAERESLRVDLDEAHRTLIGHFRHEIGHYYWDLLVRGTREDEFKRVFGDHEQPTYAEALERHYKEGPPASWRENYISAYAAMHPLEDFAETFAAYLELVAVLDTAKHVGIRSVPDVRTATLEEMVSAQRRIGIALNEMNRAMGLLDFYPKLLVAPVVVKMRFVQNLPLA
jgi:hypothetical protein